MRHRDLRWELCLAEARKDYWTREGGSDCGEALLATSDARQARALLAAFSAGYAAAAGQADAQSAVEAAWRGEGPLA